MLGVVGQAIRGHVPTSTTLVTASALAAPMVKPKPKIYQPTLGCNVHLHIGFIAEVVDRRTWPLNIIVFCLGFMQIFMHSFLLLDWNLRAVHAFDLWQSWLR